MKRQIAVALAGVAILSLVTFVRVHRLAVEAPFRLARVDRVAEESELAPTLGLSARSTSLSGHVRTEDGRAIAEARVCATAVETESIGVPRATCSVAARDGLYLIDDLAVGAYTVTGEADGYMPWPGASDQVLLGAGDEKTGVDVVLVGGGAKISGLVVDATGGPVSGASIRATRVSPPLQTVAVASRDDGAFVLWVAPGPVVLTAEAVGYAPGRLFHVAPSVDAVFRLTPGSRISGRVVSAIDDSPVSGVDVRAVPLGGWASPMHPSGLSEAEGTFSITGMEPGAYKLVAEGLRWRGQSPGAVEVGLAQAIDEIVLKVSPAAMVTGRVLERASGEPCPRGSVTLGPTAPVQTSPYDPPSAPHETSISSAPTMLSAIAVDGSVQFRGTQAGRYHISVQCEGRVLSNGPTSLEVRGADITGLEWRVSEGLGLVVHVVDSSGNALPNARFVLVYPAQTRGGPAPMMPLGADLDGRYEMRGMMYPGTYTLRPDGGYEGAPVEVELREGASNVEATLRLEGSGSILATVKTSGGELLDDASVSATLADGDSGPPAGPQSGRGPHFFAGVALGSGRFQIGPLRAGRYRVRVDDGVNATPSPSERQEQDLVEVRSGAASEATLVLDRGGHIRGHVVDGNRQGVPDVWVSATCGEGAPESAAHGSPPPGMVAPSRRVVSDADGSFRVDGLAPGTTCTVRAEQPYGPVGLRADVQPGDEVTVTLPALGALAGSASEAGQPLEQFTMTLHEARTGRVRTETVIAPGGTWRLDRVVPGQLAIYASDGHGGAAQESVTLGEGETRGDISLELTAPRADPQAQP